MSKKVIELYFFVVFVLLVIIFFLAQFKVI